MFHSNQLCKLFRCLGILLNSKIQRVELIGIASMKSFPDPPKIESESKVVAISKMKDNIIKFK